MAKFDLVFEGGGAKGAAFGGAMDAFTAAGHEHRRIIGTSAGAITATLLGAGYSAKEMLAACNETLPGTNDPVFTTFMDAPQETDFSVEDRNNSQTMELLKKVPLHIPFLGDRLSSEVLNAALKVELYREVFSFNECGGFYSGNAFLRWFRAKLQAKNIDPDITWDAFTTQTHSDVSVVTSDVSEEEMVVLNARTAPKCPVALSVRMSMSIPFVWREMVWQDKWGTYLGKSKTGNIFVDGGVLSNFPLALVTGSSSRTEEIMGTTNPNDAGTLGLLLDEKLEVPGVPDESTQRPRLRASDRATRLIDAMTGTSDAAVIRDNEKLICRLPVKGYGTTEFRMKKEKMDALIAAGRDAMNRYLNRLAATATVTT